MDKKNRSKSAKKLHLDTKKARGVSKTTLGTYC